MRLFGGTLGLLSKQMNSEFVKQSLRENLARTLVPHVADGLWSVYDSAKSACERNKQPEKTLQTFQNLLTRIPQWTDEILTTEVQRILTASKCDYIEDLLLGVFVSYIRAFAALQQADATHVQIDFDRPSLNVFLHGFYKLAARKSWMGAGGVCVVPCCVRVRRVRVRVLRRLSTWSIMHRNHPVATRARVSQKYDPK